MALLVSSRFDEIEQAMRSVDGRYLLRSRSTGEWRLKAETFGDLATMVGTNGAAVVYEGATPAAFVMLIGNGFSNVNGERLAPDQFVWVSPKDEFQTVSGCGVQWTAIFVPAADVQRWVDSDVTQLHPRFLRQALGRSDFRTLRRLTELVISSTKFAATSSEPVSSHWRLAVHAELMDAVLETLLSTQAPLDARRGRPRLDGLRIIREVRHFVDQRLDQAVRVGDVCSAVGISATALEKIANEQLGTSFHRYLLLRRLHAIHAVLRDAESSEPITSIYSRFGIGDFGRFSSRYRQLFGTLPSHERKRQDTITS
ncbi:MAG: helix-turn-helix domain-containing protein [Xanthobacteraceae bacterium]